MRSIVAAKFLIWAARLPLPKKIFAHGWLLFRRTTRCRNREGNVGHDHARFKNVIGADALRYFLLREIPFGADGNFSYDALIGRYNSDLANGLGNLASRTLAVDPTEGVSGLKYRPEQAIAEVIRAAEAAVESALQNYDEFNFSKALETTWSFIAILDKFIVEQAPWKAGDPSNTLYTAAEALRIVTTALVAPIIPESAAKILDPTGACSTSLEAIRSISDLQVGWACLSANK